METMKFYKGKNVLVTGAAGFIGSHLVEALVDVGARVSALVHYNALSSIGNLIYLGPDKLSKVNVLFGNIEDAGFVDQIMKDQEVIFHLAALIAIPYSYVAPRSYVNANVVGTLNVLESARRSGAKRVVHTSTSEVYGTALYSPICESHPLQGQSPYSATKIAADKLAEAYYRSFEIPVLTVRPFNTYGPRQSARAVIPTIISQALTKSEILLGDLKPERDLTYVSDTVQGFLCAGQVAGVHGEVFNLGVGTTQSVGAIADMILAVVGKKIPVIEDQSRIRPKNSEVFRLISDNSKSRSKLSWQPKVSLHEGLAQTVEFVSRNIDLYNPNRYTV